MVRHLSTKKTRNIILVALLLVSCFSYAHLEFAAGASPFSAGLSEAHSALNYGVENNFTVTTEGGVQPFTYTWYVDNQTKETGFSPYYSINFLAAGSHKVYVDVKDTNNTLATTNAVSFEVLPALSSSPGQSPTQSNSPAQSPIHSSPIPNYILAIVLAIILVAIILGIALWRIYRNKRFRK
jgi:hypothetical protein